MALVDGYDRRQEGAAVVARTAEDDRRFDRHEARQVGVFSPQAVQHPRADRRPVKRDTAGVQLREGCPVLGTVAVHAVEQAKVVGVPGGVWKQVADPQTAFAVLPEVPLREPKNFWFLLRLGLPSSALSLGL